MNRDDIAKEALRWFSMLVVLATEPQGRWIRPEERQPELGALVLGWTSLGALGVFSRRDNGEGGWLWARQTWAWSLADACGLGIDEDYVLTHWMPLPPAPGQEKP